MNVPVRHGGDMSMPVSQLSEENPSKTVPVTWSCTLGKQTMPHLVPAQLNCPNLRHHCIQVPSRITMCGISLSDERWEYYTGSRSRSENNQGSSLPVPSNKAFHTILLVLTVKRGVIKLSLKFAILAQLIG